MKPDRLIFTINNKNDNQNTPTYNGELNHVKKELEDKINKLIFDFENKYKVLVIFDEIDIVNTEKRVNISLLIDLNSSKFLCPHP